jgi:cob(I)alamin adenosyltransferase
LVAAASGHDEEARRLLEHAISEFEACEMSLYREAARASLGVLLRGDSGAAQLARAGAWLRAQEVVAPAKLLEMLAPGLDFSGLGQTS